MYFKNMKISVTADQPLDDIVRELERLGYKHDGGDKDDCETIVAYKDGTYCFRKYWSFQYSGNLTTLAELKEM